MPSSIIDKQINGYLPQLTVKQKKAVLTVVKTFAEEHEEDANEYSSEFKKELDDRYEDYINGEKLLSEKAVNTRIKKIINGKAKK